MRELARTFVQGAGGGGAPVRAVSAVGFRAALHIPGRWQACIHEDIEPPSARSNAAEGIAFTPVCLDRQASAFRIQTCLMLVSTVDLPNYRDQVAMVDGGFDPLHAGHVEYFREASELGAPLLCNVSSDDWVSRKHPVLLPQAERATVIDGLRAVSFTHASQTTTVEVLRMLKPRYYVKGVDWRGRLPQIEQAVCSDSGIEIVYLDTVLNSSSDILRDYERRLRGATWGDST